MRDVLHAGGQQAFPRSPQELAVAVVDEGEAPLAIRAGDAGRRLRQDGREPRFARPQALFRQLALVDVLRRAVPLDDPAGRVPPREGPRARPAVAAGQHLHPMLDIVRDAGRDRAGPGLGRVGEIVGVQTLSPAFAEA